MEAAPWNRFAGNPRYELHKMVTEADVRLWTELAGAPLAVPRATAFAQQTALSGHATHRAYLTGLVVATASRFATELSPSGAEIVNVAVQFLSPVLIGATIEVLVTVGEWDARANTYWLDIRATLANGTVAVTGKAGLCPHALTLPVSPPPT